ncbi:MAG: recombinase [Firmicutes bacterium]|jgi:hypothetical protein|nr:recombinase [Bacillota bacterium]
MSHIPYGYLIENGKAVVDEQAAKKIKTLFQSYLSGDSLTSAAKKADIKAFHAGIGRMLRNKYYFGDGYYPAIIEPDTFEAAEAERIRRAEKLGRIHESEIKKEIVYPSTFRIVQGTEQFDDPFQQAEYAYSLIESEDP